MTISVKSCCEEIIEQKYASWNSDLGKKIRNHETTLEELSAYAELPGSGRQKYLESVFNSILFR
ncbi:MAG: hypothetical protein IJ130_08810 [Solobacterium sp.]|nr:hypothetical protein [Solobacterium sp.]